MHVFFSHLHLKTFALPKHKSIQWKEATLRAVKAGLRLNICSKVIHGAENSQVIECWLILAFLTRPFMTCSACVKFLFSFSDHFQSWCSGVGLVRRRSVEKQRVLTDWLPRAENGFDGLLTPGLQFWIGFCPRQAWSLPLFPGRHYLYTELWPSTSPQWSPGWSESVAVFYLYGTNPPSMLQSPG